MVMIGVLLGGWLDKFVVNDIVLYLHMVVKVLFECLGQLGVETPFLKIRKLYAR